MRKHPLILKPAVVALILALGISLAPPAFATPAFQVDTGGTLTNGLRGYYKLDTNSNDSWAGSDGLINGTDTSVTYDVAGKVGFAAAFNPASSSKVDFGNYLDATTTPFTISGWMVAWTVANYPCVVCKTNYDGVSDYEVRFVNSTGQLNAGWYGAAGDQVSTASSTFADGVYHQFTMYRDGSNVYLETDRWQSVSATNNLRNVTNALSARLGLDAGNNYPFHGSVDELGFWDRALTAQERTDLWNGGAGQTMVEAGAAAVTRCLVGTGVTRGCTAR